MPTDITPLSDAAVNTAAQHVSSILDEAFEHTPDRAAVVIWDGGCPLALTLMKAYKRCLPGATFIEFDLDQPASQHSEILATFAELVPSDLVVLIQSTSFRLSSFRIRVNLFNQKVKVLEHPHLVTMSPEESLIYIDSLAYDSNYYRGVGEGLRSCIDQAQTGVITSGEERLIFSAAFEKAKLNVGDYSKLKNVGGQYPIGEVFTESKDLEEVNGCVQISAFGDTNFRVNRPKNPITLVIQKGRVVDTIDSTPEFDVVLENIRADEEEVWIREVGFGLNRAFSMEKMVCDIGSFERMCGVHLSLGKKHMSYKKPQVKKNQARHHVDVFVLTDTVVLDDQVIFEQNGWTVTSKKT